MQQKHLTKNIIFACTKLSCGFIDEQLFKQTRFQKGILFLIEWIVTSVDMHVPSVIRVTRFEWISIMLKSVQTAVTYTPSDEHSLKSPLSEILLEFRSGSDENFHSFCPLSTCEHASKKKTMKQLKKLSASHLEALWLRWKFYIWRLSHITFP